MPVLESHSHDEFNAYGQVWTIVQDRRGLMYFGVSGGDVLEYDGVSWRKIDTAMEIVRSLAIDDSGKIWYYKADGRIRQIENYGSQWSVGIKGDF